MDNTDKQIAELVEKCYSGNVSEEEIIALLGNLLPVTSLGKIVGDNIPFIEFNDERAKEDEDERIDGYHINGDDTVHLSSSIIKKIQDKDSLSVFEMLSTYGHETTHHTQDVHTYDYHVHVFKKEEVDEICDFFEMRYKGHADKSLFKKMVKYGEYLSRPWEKEAREGGAIFAVEVLENLLDNKYISNDCRDKIEKELKHAQTNVKDYDKVNDYYCNMYSQFKKTIQEIPLSYFKSELVYKDNDVKEISDTALSTAVFMRLEKETPENISSYFLKCIGMDPFLYGSLKGGFLERINDSKFPKNVKDKLSETITNGLNKSGVDSKFYDSIIVDVLSEQQLLSVYKNAFINNIQLLSNSSLFFALNRKTEIAEKIGEIIVNEYKNVKITKEDDPQILYSVVNTVLSHGGNELSSKMKKELKQIKKKVESKMKKQKAVKR